MSYVSIQSFFEQPHRDWDRLITQVKAPPEELSLFQWGGLEFEIRTNHAYFSRIERGYCSIWRFYRTAINHFQLIFISIDILVQGIVNCSLYKQDTCRFSPLLPRAYSTTYAYMLVGSRCFHVVMVFIKLLLSGKSKLKALYLFIHRYCSSFTHSGAWFSVSNCKHYKMHLFRQEQTYNNR